MQKQKKGISLIVLVITIIVMLILASAVVITLSNTNIITKAKEAVEKTNAANNMYLSEIKLAERTLEKTQGASKVKDKEAGVLRVENEGKEDETYYIESIDDLVAFSTSVNEGNTYEGKTVMLTQLLDFNSDKSYVDVSLKETVTTGEGFEPIGNIDNPFKGTFDGDGTEIRNIYINTKGNMNKQEIGLFGQIEDAVVKNVGVTGTIIGEGCVAGIVGVATAVNKTTYIQNCYNKSKIYAEIEFVDTYVGGIVAFAWGESEENKVIIEDCYNEGQLEGKGMTAIAGVVNMPIYCEINRCYNVGNIYTYDVSFVGGIVAQASESKIYNSYNIGDITAINNQEVGGIAGEIESTQIYNVYNAGKIILKTNVNDSAGIVGSVYENSKIGNAFNIGIIEGEYNWKYECVGGYGEEDIDKPLYYVLGRNNPSLVVTDKFVSKTLLEMNSQAFVDELNENIKDMPECVKWKLGNNGYPVLDM